jgi:hypothetical protein
VAEEQQAHGTPSGQLASNQRSLRESSYQPASMADRTAAGRGSEGALSTHSGLSSFIEPDVRHVRSCARRVLRRPIRARTLLYSSLK